MFLPTAMLRCTVFVVVGLLCCCQDNITSAKMYDKQALIYAREVIGLSFENRSDLNSIKGSGYNISERHTKYGQSSLQWVWSYGSQLTIDLSNQLPHEKICGVSFWMYRENEIKSHLNYHLIYRSIIIETRRIAMDFTGWRAFYIPFKIIPSKGKIRRITQLQFDAPQLYLPFEDVFYFDLIRFAMLCSAWSYDRLSPPLEVLPNNEKNGLGGIIDLDGRFNNNNKWQQTYKWSEYERLLGGKSTDDSALSTIEENQVKEIEWIDRRLEAWLLVPDDLLFSKTDLSFARYMSLHCKPVNRLFLDPLSKLLVTTFKKAPAVRKLHSRFSQEFTVCVENAKMLAGRLKNADGKLAPLFSSRDSFGTYFRGNASYPALKFNDIIHSILFPLALDHYLTKKILRKAKSSSKKARVKKRNRRPNILASGRPRMEATISKLRQDEIVNPKNTTESNNLVLIMRLFDYLHDEGFTEGSGVGVLDHFMNLNAMYCHSVYLLRKELHASGRLHREIRTMKWYAEIGEVRRNKKEQVGTTADRLRNFAFDRLLLILTLPRRTNRDKRTLIKMSRDFKEWLDASLLREEGFNGVIKPDYIGFHHRGAYLSAYVPKALHTASLINYLTHNTTFALAENSLSNLRKALKFMYLTSNDYSVPVGVSGRFISYTNNAMADLIPAFAYASVGSWNGLQDFHVETGLIFLKLFRLKDPVVQRYLRDGAPEAASQYHNSLGSIALLIRIRRVLVQNKYYNSYNPQGHWTSNYGGLSVHRRDGWTATVKGCSMYVWDYEAGRGQNVYGRFLSHGNLQIANGRRALFSHDILNGWRWTAIPGTTTVDLPMKILKYKGHSRNFARSAFNGGVHLTGSRGFGNGLFAMDYLQPLYREKVNYNLRFKKSYHFVEDLIICLGSDITEDGGFNGSTITTIFQNRMFNDSFIAIDGKRINYVNSFHQIINDSNSHFLLDSNNNGYFIPKASSLKVSIEKPDKSYRPDGTISNQTKIYTTAIIDHGNSPEKANYEYAILIGSGLDLVKRFMKAQSNPFEKFYAVLRADNVAHIVKVITVDYRIFYSYAIFNAKKFNRRRGPITRVNRPCLILVEEHRNGAVSISINDPDLRLRPLKYRGSCKEECGDFNAKSIPKEMIVRLNYKDIELSKVYNQDRHLKLSTRLLPDYTGNKRLLRLVLAKGLTTEVILTHGNLNLNYKNQQSFVT